MLLPTFVFLLRASFSPFLLSRFSPEECGSSGWSRLCYAPPILPLCPRWLDGSTKTIMVQQIIWYDNLQNMERNTTFLIIHILMIHIYKKHSTLNIHSSTTQYPFFQFLESFNLLSTKIKIKFTSLLQSHILTLQFTRHLFTCYACDGK